MQCIAKNGLFLQLNCYLILEYSKDCWLILNIEQMSNICQNDAKGQKKR